MTAQKRRDLDALRGIAILSVILFHIDAPYFTNGHFGVDIFFVLSGYFIFTSHCNTPHRPLFEFFAKRIWRIFPAYFTFTFLTTVAAYFLLIPDDFIEFLRDLRPAAVFASNFKSPTEQDYWDTLKKNYFLLHTWSLSVEIQFYIFSVPIALLLKQTGKYYVFLLMLLSFGLHFFVSEVVAFYSLPCRLWQFLCGYVVINWQHSYDPVDIEKQVSRIDYKKSFCALAILFFCIVFNCQRMLILQRIMVTALSSYVVSSTSQGKSWIELLWNNNLFWFLGAVSYSWYLWHWPAAVLISYLYVDIMSPFNLFLYLIVPLGIAVVSTYLLERPLLKKHYGKMVTLSVCSLLPLIFVSASLIFSQITVSMKNSSKDPKSYRPTYLRYCQDVTVQNACFLGNANSTDHTIIWGDSFAMTAFLAHSWYLPEIVNKTKVTLFTRGNCPPYYECEMQNIGCADHNAQVFELLWSMGAKRVILSSRYIFTYRKILVKQKHNETAAKIVMQECLMSTIGELIRIGIKEILLLHQIPEPSQSIPQFLEKALKFGWDLKKIHINRTEHEKNTAGLHESIIQTGNLTQECSVIDPATVLCNEEICPTWYITENNVSRPLYFDAEHLNEYGMKSFSKLFTYPWKVRQYE